jgi:adenine-specific DNA-methyltransferase
MAIDFLGNKDSLLDFIFQSVLPQTNGKRGVFLDLFSGTGSVAKRACAEGFTVFANDFLQTSRVFAEADLLYLSPNIFSSLESNVLEASVRHNSIDRIESHLNNLAPKEGTIYKHYSPASIKFCEHNRMYFTESNAMKIDAIRYEIESWTPFLTQSEKSLLLKHLIKASNKVANTAGTYGCFLKKWKQKATEPIKFLLNDVPTVQKSKRQNRVFNLPANDLVKEIPADIIYADPPYTKRQYAAYYHILETIIHGDEPAIEGSTGLRPWKHLSSDYCYKRKASGALDDLVKHSKCSHFFLSYNEDGQIEHQNILTILGKYGAVSVQEKEYRRYKSSSLSHKGLTLRERLYHLKKFRE